MVAAIGEPGRGGHDSEPVPSCAIVASRIRSTAGGGNAKRAVATCRRVHGAVVAERLGIVCRRWCKVGGALLVAGGVLLAGWQTQRIFASHKRQTDPKWARAAGLPIPVKSVAVQDEVADASIAGECLSESPLTVEVSTDVALPVLRVAIALGDTVSAGQELMQLDQRELGSALAITREAQESAGRTVSELMPHLDTLRQLRAKTFISQTDVIRAVKDVGQAHLDFARARRETIAAEFALERARIAAPVDGVVTALNVGPGSFPKPNAVLAEVSQIDPLRLRCTFADETLPILERHRGAEAQFNAAPGKSVAVHTARILPTTDRQSRALIVLFTLPNPDRSVLIGMQGVVRVFERVSGLLIPAIAIVKRDRDVATVMVVENGGIARYREIEVGPYAGGRVAVLRGLAAGDRVVVAGQVNLLDGDRVREGSDRTTDGHRLAPPDAH